MAIPKHVFNILNSNMDLVWSNQFKMKHLVERVQPCASHNNNLSLIYKCKRPFCGPSITEKQAYYYLSQFRKNHPVIQAMEACNDQSLAKIINKYYDDGVPSFDKSFRDERKVTKKEFFLFMEQVLNTSGFKNSNELYKHFTNHFKSNTSIYSVKSNKDQRKEELVNGRAELYKVSVVSISRTTFNRYLKDYYSNESVKLCQYKHKLMKASGTQIGYYTEEN
ncbi:hypothetical protein [Acinetobacter rudis]|uniref:Uncharacterized protein n=1 Tax=Acinetobacter rudis TaxID=632955 RepID=A0AAW8JDE8_9GAMM|nr:hypothetical protein [Acinetobacter rudis]MDQ8937121.1 hypothetical protein [Acinetobacter rudis]MDQ9019336.1 hypothetical protein [Acinetobacter rudis]